jgi:NADH dehydrogenase (ubiquinone) 1 beta subcomplex subunit 8
MLSRQALATRSLPLTSLSRSTSRALATTSRLRVRTDINVLDPGLNGSYPNPPAIKRQFRDPHAKYWDQQERRNYGEPIHEDNDVLNIFSTEAYTWTKPGWGAVLFTTFIASVVGLAAVVWVTYPEKPSVPREFDLVEELGGKEALLVSGVDGRYAYGMRPLTQM